MKLSKHVGAHVELVFSPLMIVLVPKLELGPTFEAADFNKYPGLITVP